MARPVAPAKPPEYCSVAHRQRIAALIPSDNGEQVVTMKTGQGSGLRIPQRLVDIDASAWKQHKHPYGDSNPSKLTIWSVSAVLAPRICPPRRHRAGGRMSEFWERAHGTSGEAASTAQRHICNSKSKRRRYINGRRPERTADNV
ncbi:hypothetical protein LTR36_003796 [Oleoguttula mirabilis]|uniref:Uncharacterized protein n=1 Tax=Oleoguttula mirabilis TaxID=1507867 RepID=A0AAV9JIK1_9PEZI|nr:hypothetical protein LTR36_003796 [Oleoguttula mirabilis]